MLEALGVDVKTIIFAIINFLILLGVLTKFLYKPFIKLLDDRKQAIRDSFENAELTNKRADEKYAALSKKLADADADAQEIIRKATLDAQEQAELIVQEAREKAEMLVEQAQTQIEQEKEAALVEMKSQIAELSMMAAAKIVEKELESTGQDAIIDEIIRQAGSSKWQN